MIKHIQLIKKIAFVLSAFLILHLAFFVPNVMANGVLDFLWDPVGSFKQMINEWLAEVASAAATSAFEFIGVYIIGETDISIIPGLDDFLLASKGIAAALALLFFYLQMLNYFRDLAADEEDGPPTVIVVNFVVSLIWIGLIDKVIIAFLIPLNNMIVSMIATTKIDATALNTDILTVPGTLVANALQIIIMYLIVGIAILVFAVQGAIRYVDIAILLIVGPLIGAKRTMQKEAISVYLQEAVAIIFIQVIHIIICYYILQFLLSGTLHGILLTIGATVVSMRGPQAIRQYIYSSGTAGAVSGAGKFALIKMLMKK